MPCPVPRPKDEEQKRAERQAIFDSWLVECAEIQNAVIEGLLANLPSAQD